MHEHDHHRPAQAINAPVDEDTLNDAFADLEAACEGYAHARRRREANAMQHGVARRIANVDRQLFAVATLVATLG